MTPDLSSLFDFSSFAADSEHYVALLRRFAAAEPFRDATADELLLDDDYHRRPLHAEDFVASGFAAAAREHELSAPSVLAANRALLSINELEVARMPAETQGEAWQRFVAFHSDQTHALGAQLAPFLEAHTFSWLGAPAQRSNPALDAEAASSRLGRLIDAETAFWEDTFGRLMRHDYLEEGLRFVMIQRGALVPSQFRALARAESNGFFDTLPLDAQPNLSSEPSEHALFERAAVAGKVTRQQHTYWQFYLPTSLAKCNLLYALSRRPDRAFALTGAAFGAEAERVALAAGLRRACPHLQPGGQRAADAVVRRAELLARFTHALEGLASYSGPLAFLQCEQGLLAASRLAVCARRDLGAQLHWLSSIPRHLELARRIGARLDKDSPGIECETRIEPPERRSTLCVRSGHRLVSVAQGELQLWGNVGTALKLGAGDRLLIPQGRLYGALTMPGGCTWHQSSVPDDWLKTFDAEPDSPAENCQ